MSQYVSRPGGTEGDLIGVADVGQLLDGAQIDVAPNEAAVFVKGGYVRGRLGPGRHVLAAGSRLAEELLAPGSTTVCFVSTGPIAGLEVGGSLGRMGSSTNAPREQMRAYAELSIQVIHAESFVAAALPSDSQAAEAWLNAQLLQALQRTVTKLITAGEVTLRTLAESTALVDHHLCRSATDLEAAGVRVLEVTEVKVPEAGAGDGAPQPTLAEPAEVPAGKTVLGDVPLEALTDSSGPPDGMGAALGQAGQSADWASPTPQQPSAHYEQGGTPMHAATGGSGMYGYANGYGHRTASAGYHSGRSSSGSGCMIGGVLVGLAAVVLGAVAALAFWSTQSTTSARSGSTTKPVTAVVWDGHSRFSCTSGSKRIQNVTAAVSQGAAIYASGSCSLLLENVDIKSPVAIKAADAAQVTVDGGSIRGTTHSIEVSDRAKVFLKGGATVRGSFAKSGSGKVLRIKQP
ncbi:MAG: hypothetical protein JRI23_09895 [Deltaproteobacteria bacterium]|jgi:hypothetical protein|nr:hypothetical protein [Deltaproteobacteria bacterium]MBW2531980.1 hypothetical protein [Deltaproteobacteria bacterium]